MAYTPVTKIPNLTFFQWSRPDAPNPRLAAPIDNDDTTLTFTSAPQDYLGAVITGNFLMGVKNSDSFTELIYVPSGGMSADGLTASNVIRGIRITGLDFTTGDSSFAAAHEQDSPVFCAVSAVYESIIQACLQGGTVATGGLNFVIGNGAAGTVTILRDNGTQLGFVRHNGTKVQFSNDGTVWTNFDSVAASNLVAATAADTTPGYLNDKLVVNANTMTKTTLNGGGNEQIQLNARGTLANIVSDVTATVSEVNKLAGTSANVTAVNLNTLTAGPSSNGDAFHSHQNPTTSFVALEAVTAGNAVALLPNEVQWYTQLTGANLSLGDSNVRRKHSVKFVPSRTVTTLTDLNFRAAEAVNGATTLGNLIVSIQTDNAGAPSGTAVTNATATISQATQRTWNTTQATRVATFAGNVALVSGTTYHLVFECSATDGTNYLNISVNSSHDENYVTYTRLTYNLDTTSWGTSTTNATPFFWGNTESVPFGMGVVPTDANWGARTWNFVGFAKANASVNASVDVYYDIVPNLTLTRGALYYLSDTAGAITTTAPATIYASGTEPTTFTYRIGRALADGTSLKIEKGQKRVVVTESGLSATTARKYVTWFKPEFVRGSSSGTGGSYASMASGFALADATDNSVNVGINNAGASTAALGANLLNNDNDGSNTFTTVASAYTDAGLTVTFTEANTSVVNAWLEIIQ